MTTSTQQLIPGDRVEWSQPGQVPFSFTGTIYGPHPVWPDWWIVAWVSSGGRPFDARVHANYIRKATR